MHRLVSGLRQLTPSLLLTFGAFAVFGASASAQTPPWTGVLHDESRPDGISLVWSGLSANALSGDGRFLVFQTDLAMVPEDTNEEQDAYLRDRHTGVVTRVGVSASGLQSDYGSWSPSISRDGRQIAFTSCGYEPPGGPIRCNSLVRDRVLETTTVVSRGPNGEPQTSLNSFPPVLSGDGRFVLFSGHFDPSWNYNVPLHFWLRDRDGDGDGIFDEPGESTTTQVSGATVGDDTLHWLAGSAMSSDARWIAYTASTYNTDAQFIGWRLFLHDRTTGTTVRVDQPSSNDYGFSYFPAFSDTGELVYVSDVNNLVPGDTSNILMDLFVVDLSTLAHTQLVRTDNPGSSEDSEWWPTISADGRYVIYVGSRSDVVAIDRVTGESQVVNRRPDGSGDEHSGHGSPSISADGSAIAFEGTAAMLVNGSGPDGIFVTSAVDVSPAEISATNEAGTFSFDVVVPADVAWTIKFKTDTGVDTVTPQSGFGPGSVDVSIFENFSGEARDHVIGLGSKTVTIHQDAGTGEELVTPSSGSVEGGTEVTIHGSDFQEGAIVTFGGADATSVTWVSNTEIIAVTPAHTPSQWVNVVVANPDASGSEFANAFRYIDTTAPELTPSITGTLGANGWYVSEVRVTWTATDPESAVRWQNCPTFTLTYDSVESVTCSAESEGGQADESIEVKRDTEVPTISIDSPGAPGTYVVDQAVAVSFTCEDPLTGPGASGLASCSANYARSLDTSTAGEFVLTITAVDEAGNTTTESIPYTVEKRTPIITWADPASLTYPAVLSGMQLNATADAPGTLSYSHPLGTALDAGYYELTVTFAPSNPEAYNTASATVILEVRPATVEIYWAPIDPISYGTALTATQLNAEHTANTGTLEYYPDAGTILDAGTRTLTAYYVPEDSNYEYAEATRSITVLKATPSLSWTSPSSIVYGTTLGATQLNATASVAGSFAYAPAAGTVLNAGSHALMVTFTPSNATNYNSVSKTVVIVVSKAATTITWANPAVITFGTALSATQLNATASVAGSLVYSPAAGTVLNAGTRILNVIFTPTNSNYNSASRNVTLVVGKATPAITWPNPAGIAYGTALTATQLNATADVAGSFAYTPAAGAVLNSGTRTLSVTFTPFNAANYNGASRSVNIVVGKATPTITWSNPAGITYGAALGGAHLNATASVAGSFAYSPASGTILNAGTQSLSVTFTPTDAANYNSASSNVDIVVAKATPAITWSNPPAITYGTALSATQLNATTSAGGSFAYSPAAGSVVDAGTQTLAVTFTPTDAANYNSATANVDIVVVRATPAIAWSNPAGIAYGTALSAAQLSATADVVGSFAYSPVAGAVLDAGVQTLSVTFTPSDASNYNGASGHVTIVVAKATPAISWSNPADITYGTALSAAQLNGTASVAGSFAYSPAAGTVLNAGTQTLSATFTPSDAANYEGASGSVTIVVGKATPTITWSNPAGITYGTALSATQLNATANAPGSFAYSPAAGAVPGAGAQTLSVTFTPTDAANYTTAATTQSIAVATKALTVNTNNAAKVYGQALPAFTISGVGFVNGDTAASLSGTPSFATPATATSAPGNYSVTPSGVSSANYTITFAAGTLTISKANTTVALSSSPSPSTNNQTVTLTATVAAVAPGGGVPTGTVEFRDNGTTIGTAALVNGVATMTKSLKKGTHQLTATYIASTNYNGGVGSKTHQVN